VVTIHVLYGAPSVEKIRRPKVACHLLQIHMCGPAGRGDGDRIPQASPKAVVPASIESSTAVLRKPDHIRVDAPVLGDVDGVGLNIPRSICKILTEAPAIVCTALYDHARLIVTKSINVIFLQEEHGVVDEELPHLALPNSPNWSSVILVGEIQAVVIGGAGHAIEEPDAFVLSLHLPASVVVHHVEQHRHAVGWKSSMTALSWFPRGASSSSATAAMPNRARNPFTNPKYPCSSGPGATP